MSVKDRLVDYATDIMKSGINRSYRTERKPSGVRLLENIGYAQDNNDAHLLDIAYPDGVAETLPVIINIHGGGFSMNSKEKLYKYYAMRLAKCGFAVVNINYRLSIEAPFPAQLQDVFSVLKFIESYHSAFKLDINNVFLVGDSAGAYMAAMTECILTNPMLRKEYKVDTTVEVRGLGLNCGMYDFDTFLGKDIFFPAKKDIVMLLFGSRDFVMLPVYQFTSVFQHSTEGFCPCYIMDSEYRSFAPEARRLKWIFDQKGIEYQIRLYSQGKRLPHVFHLMNKYVESKLTRKEMTDFFKGLIAK